MMPPGQSAPATHPLRPTPQLLLGSMVIIAGILLTLDNLDIIDAARYIRFWPAGIIAIGLLKLFQSRERDGSGFTGAIFVLVGSWLLLEQTTVVRISVWDLWPVLLVFLGGFLVWQALTGPRVKTPAPSPSSDANAVITGTAILSSVVRGNNSSNFRGGDLTAVMGGCEIDLRNASIDGDAVIDVFALWGGIEIRVPADWTVVSQITPVLAGVEDKTRPPQTASRHRLILRGVIVMAGVEIQN